MALEHRPMQPEDVAECVEIVATHAAIGTRYGAAIGNLGQAWLRLLKFEAKRATVFEKREGLRAQICAVGVSVFVDDSFLREIKTQPLFWVGPELARRIKGGSSPVLSDVRFRQLNAHGGLNLVVWEGCVRREFEKDPEIPSVIMDGFLEDHRGLLLNEIVGSQVESVERLKWTLHSGGLLWDPISHCYTDVLTRKPDDIVNEPHIIGLTRTEVIKRQPWSVPWVGTLFLYSPPKFGFSRSEQELLSLALAGQCGTDEELAIAMDVSQTTIKKMWVSIYRRVRDRQSEMVLDYSREDTEHKERGREKRRRLLTYLRNHPEEVRPVRRKDLGKPSAGYRTSM